jgi:sterol desaturase/sphingolipid hydroxylase (fatty acid hydroxylase superfamily)
VARARLVVAVATFPLLMGGAIAACIAMMNAGIDPTVSYLAPTGVAFASVALLERVVPHQESWKHSRGDLHVDLGHAVVSGGVTVEALRPLMLALAVALGTRLHDETGASPWPDGWPLVAQLLLALVIGEFFMYWVHRLAHEWEILWRFHALHHSAPRLYFLNAARFHPVDLAISNFAPFVPLVALGAGPELLALFALFTAVHGMFQHANIPVRLGPFNWFFAMSELHRWHHSRRLAESNTNYGQNLIVWDVVFGTRFLPADREPPEEIGLADLPAFPMTYLAQVASPFTWRRIVRESARPADDPRAPDGAWG